VSNQGQRAAEIGQPTSTCSEQHCTLFTWLLLRTSFVKSGKTSNVSRTGWSCLYCSCWIELMREVQELTFPCRVGLNLVSASRVYLMDPW
jgi:hypothetical protein